MRFRSDFLRQSERPEMRSVESLTRCKNCEFKTVAAAILSIAACVYSF
jgi:hypothetical protein